MFGKYGLENDLLADQAGIPNMRPEIMFDVLIKSPIKEILGWLCRQFGIRLARKSGWVQR
jgi:hypothetical protein